MNARRSFYRIFRTTVLSLIVALSLVIAPCWANRIHAADATAALPYSDTLSLSREDGGEKWVEFSCERLSIVTLSARSLTEGAIPELSVYTDEGRLIDRTSTQGSAVLMQILPAYTGVHRVLVEYRGVNCPNAEISLDIREYGEYKENEPEKIPFSSVYTEDSHRTVDAQSVYGHCTDTADGYLMSVFSLNHTAGGILSYTLTSPEGDAVARLYTYDGDMYRSTPSHSAEGHEAGDACEVYYSADSYLLVYSHGEFSLDMDLLERHEYTATPISIPYSGRLDVSGGTQTYDVDAFERILAEHPYSDISNPHVRLYEITSGSASVVSLLCERREHSSFSLVTAEHGLSVGSEYPLREFGSYCSETRPTQLCYESVLCDTERLYLAYTGNAESVYIELDASPSHQAQTEYQEKYNKSDIIPHAVLSSVFSDEHIYEHLGVTPIDIGITRITGYMIESEDGTRYYYGTSDDITPPYKKGECRLWVTLTSTGTDAEGKEVSAVHRLLLCRFSTTGVIIIPTLEEMIESIKEGEPISLLYILLMLLPIAAIAGITLLILKLRKKKAAAKSTPHRPRPKRTPVILSKEEADNEEVNSCSESSDQEENVSSRQ